MKEDLRSLAVACRSVALNLLVYELNEWSTETLLSAKARTNFLAASSPEHHGSGVCIC